MANLVQLPLTYNSLQSCGCDQMLVVRPRR
jgi:hypothetical protein